MPASVHNWISCNRGAQLTCLHATSNTYPRKFTIYFSRLPAETVPRCFKIAYKSRGRGWEEVFKFRIKLNSQVMDKPPKTEVRVFKKDGKNFANLTPKNVI